MAIRTLSPSDGPTRWGIALLVFLLGRAIAADDAAAPEPAPAQPAPPVAYDALFRLPSDSRPQPGQGAALDRKRWEERFAAVRGDLDGSRAQLAKAPVSYTHLTLPTNREV